MLHFYATPGLIGYVFVLSESGEMCAMKEVTLCSDDPKSRESAQQLGQVSYTHHLFRTTKAALGAFSL